MSVLKCVLWSLAVLAPAIAHAQVIPPPTSPATSQPAPVSAQQPKRSFLKKAGRLVGDLEWKGIKPAVGLIVPGGGIAAGLEFEASRIGSVPLGVDIEGLISVRNYQQLAIRVGSLSDRRSTVRLEYIDSAITSPIRLPETVAPGRMIYLEHRYRRLPGLSLFGETGADETTRTDFGQTLSATDLVVLSQRSRGVGVGARVGYLVSRPFEGRNSVFPNTGSVFGSELGASLTNDARYVVAGVGAALDGRDDRRKPTLGAVFNLAAWRYQSRTTMFASFSRFWFDARAYRMLLSPRHVLAARATGSYTQVSGRREVPFQVMQHLGGSRIMRSFSSYRFRGHNLTAGSLESRWRVWRTHELVLFVDVGHVDKPVVSLGGTRLFTSTGLGARIWLSERFVLRGEVSRGRDGVRFVGTLGTPF